HVGLAVRAHHPHLVADPALLELLAGLLHHRHVALGPHDDAHGRARLDVELLELVLHLRLRDRPARGLDALVHATSARSTARAAMSWRICLPSNSIFSAAPYARSRASAGVSPSPVTFSTRPPAVTICPSSR